ncbi:MAG TPA: TetR family transcriptional regulator C-terminal domain-containing protein, partial [Azospirillum sp.]
ANPALRAAFLGLMRRFVAHLAGTAEAGRADGSFRADLDPHDAAFVVLAMMQGLIVRWSLAGRDFDLQAEGKRLVAVLLRGILAGGHQP